MRAVVVSAVYGAYLLAGAVLAVAAPKLGIDVYAARCAGAALALTCVIVHLARLSSRRAVRLTQLLECQDLLLQQIVERLNRAETRGDAVETRLTGLGEVRATLQDVAAMLAARAVRPVLRAA